MGTKNGTRASRGSDVASEAIALGQEAYKRTRAREYDAARPLIERALSLAPDSAMLAHIKAHLCIDSGAFEDGAAYLRSFLSTHDPFEGISVHTAWHLAYLELELGNSTAALDWHRRVVAPTLMPQSFSSAVGLLWRLEVRQHGGGALRAEWEEMRAAALGITESSILDEIARAMAFIASGDDENLARLLERVDAPSDNPVVTEVVRPLLDGLCAYWRGDFAAAVDLLGPIAPSFGRLSEFVDQISVFLDTLNDARARATAGTSTARPALS